MSTAPLDPNIQCPHCDAFTSAMKSHCTSCGNDLSHEPNRGGVMIDPLEEAGNFGSGHPFEVKTGSSGGYRGAAPARKRGFAELCSFEGRYGRQDYWLTTIAVAFCTFGLQFVVGFMVGLVMAMASGGRVNEKSIETMATLVTLPITLLSMWIQFVTQIKRWHDLDKSGWWCCINAIPCAGGIYSFIMCGCTQGTRGRNKYGNDPLGGRW